MRKKLKQNPVSTENEQKIDEIEEKIIDTTDEEYAKRIVQALGNITGENGKLNNTGVCKQLNQINPHLKKLKQVPTAFKDEKGNLITNHENIKTHCLKSIVNRLRKRPMHPELVKLQKRKIKLSKIRLKRAMKRKTPPWNMMEMEKAIKSMKNKKCRDAHGLINELCIT